MGIFDVFKKSSNSSDFELLFQKIDSRIYSWQLEKKMANGILAWNDQQKTDLIIAILQAYPNVKNNENQSNPRGRTLNILTAFLVKRKIIFGNQGLEVISEILKFLQFFKKKNKVNNFGIGYSYVLKPILNNILRFHKFEKQEELDILIQIKRELESFDLNYDEKEKAKQIQKIDEVLFESQPNVGDLVKPTYFIGNDEFKNFANRLVDQQADKDKTYWHQLIAHAQKASGSKPSQKYLDESKPIIKALGPENFKKITQEWFDFIISLKESVKTHTEIFNNSEYSYNSIEFLDTLNSDAIKGFVWMSLFHFDNKTIITISKLAERCFKKIPGKGPAAAAVGNACIYTLYASKGLNGIAQLSRLKLKVKQNTTLNLIEKYIQNAADKLGVSPIEIEDLAVEDFKLENNKITRSFEDFTGVIELNGIGKSSLRWFKKDGTEQKTVPKIVKDKYADRLKKLKEKQKQIDQTTSVQKERFDRMLRTNREIPLEYFKEKYLQHRLLSFVINKVIFCFSNNQESILAIFINDQWIDLSGKIVNIENYTIVNLWHPVYSSTEGVKQWRQFLMAREILQPFKQAFREIYILTDAEIITRTYSNRMASHILKQHQYVTLAKGRNWTARLLGAWDGGDQDTAALHLPEFNLRAEYWVNALNVDDQYNNTGIWNYVSTDQVRFVNIETNELVELIKVPAIAFSEVMRDVDLFVGVASVSNDPTWQDSGGLTTYRDYWQSYSFGDLSEIAKNRKEILVGLIPRLKIAAVCSIVDKFVVIKGKLRTYKIHIGSTNILMEPNDQYLCIVPDRSKKNEANNIFIPFEGDVGLSVIISKAFLLANDDKITDTTITSQINR